MSENFDEFFDDYLDEISTSPFEDTIVTGTDWTTETIIRQIEKGNIRLSPVFQRRDAWNQERKSLFIESLLIGMPVPQLVLAEDPNERGRFIVLDGKQRLLSILQFAAVSMRDEYPALRLKNLPILSDLDNCTYEDMIERNYDFGNFENQWIRTVILKNCRSEDVLAQVFYRLNTGSLPLSPQELRFALSPGEFTRYIDEVSANSEAIKYFLGNTKLDFRMRDVELLLRIFSNSLYIGRYRGNLKLFLDDSFRELTNRFPQNQQELDDILSDMESAHSIVVRAFGENAYKKFIDGKYESRKNRSLFEVLVFVLSDARVRNAIEVNGVETLESLIVELCVNNSDFLDSIEKTTKSLRSVDTRFNALINAVNNEYSLNLSNVELGDING
ncbi:hypothetical protein OA15_21525 [Vibrio vulnificus]|uniref:DUF262 domain-containing protein n=1 Tax=Vibrio vulnificus TaxID=672 RepID=A0ABX4WWB4_VIBVL|nr:DUF262 domain-containing protein [Vibrio vulnificus]EGQ9939789.1 DUF262 domain-containing protein [Vibrio vulnificus]EGR0054855.1 DUF262 domain-containing protein [Vibrio vulnificus]KHF81732.1 hypothetical protein OA15_21525 [Vibrio vulnificus]MCU8278202.1 DUF262 domain-containing protein [Vibrio vulnificus]PNM67717.1 DUF262 domain-containing protein [Vibrio vulnificus]